MILDVAGRQPFHRHGPASWGSRNGRGLGDELLELTGLRAGHLFGAALESLAGHDTAHSDQTSTGLDSCARRAA
ncbi:MAG: hypothetical protein ACRD07_14885 [Acidimicrobiales bacterium]